MTILPYSFFPQELALDGYNLSYLDEGQGHAVVMLHGNPTWSYFYRNLITSLSPRFRTVVPDHMGCGLSDKPQDYPYTLEKHIENLTRLIDHLGLKKISLILHDWGGAIGMGYAGRFPEKIHSLVVMNTAAFISPKIPLRIRLCRLPFLGAILVRGLNGFARPALRMAVSHKLPANVAAGFIHPYDSWNNRVAVHAFVRDIPLRPCDRSWPTLFQVEKNLSRLSQVPMQIIWGGGDFCFNDHFYNEWRRRFPAARTHYIPGAGHYLLEDAFSEVAPIITSFLTESCSDG